MVTNLWEAILVEQGEKRGEDLLLGEVAGGADDGDADGASSLLRWPISGWPPIYHLCRNCFIGVAERGTHLWEPIR